MTAILDIGSNSVRLMLWADGKTLYKKVSTTRLGEGLALTGKLSAEAIARTAEAIEGFCAEARACRARIYAFATAAVRSASNGQALCECVRERCGISIDVVSGEEEALLALYGALPEEEDGGIIDIGGASTEICLRQKGEIRFRRSLPVGCVKLYDRCGDSKEALEPVIEEALSSLTDLSPCGRVYAVGGTASTLASCKLGLTAYDAAALQDLSLSADWMREEAEGLLLLKKEMRASLPGMDKSRADIIAGGALLLYKIMEKLRLPEVRFSDRDNLEGFLFARHLQ